MCTLDFQIDVQFRRIYVCSGARGESGVRDRQEVSGPVGNAGATGAARVQTPRQRFAAEAAGIL